MAIELKALAQEVGAAVLNGCDLEKALQIFLLPRLEKAATRITVVTGTSHLGLERRIMQVLDQELSR